MFENLTFYILYSPIIYLGATLTFYVISYLGLSPHASFFARCLASYACLLLCATYGVLASLYLRLFGDYRIAQWATARAFDLTMWLATGVRFDIVSGAEHLATRPMVLVGNHQSALDVLLLGAIFPRYCSVTAKASLRNIPFLGWFMRLSGTVFIDRADRVSALKAFEAAAAEMREMRQSVFIFPEGTRHSGPKVELGGFKKGAFHLAVQAQVPVVVCVSANYWGVCAVGQWRFRGGRIPVRVLPPIPTKGLTAADVDDLTQKVREVMLKELIALSETPAGKKAMTVDVDHAEEDGAMAMSMSGEKGKEKGGGCGRANGENGVGGSGVASGVDR